MHRTAAVDHGWPVPCGLRRRRGLSRLAAGPLGSWLAATAFAASCWGADRADEPASIPITIDHGRILVEVSLPLADGSLRAATAWVDTGNPELWIAGSLAASLGLRDADGSAHGPRGAERTRKTSVPDEVLLEGRRIKLTGIGESRVIPGDTIGPGLRAEINLPSSLLRHYDVEIDFTQRRLTLGPPGGLEFSGLAVAAKVNPANGLVVVPCRLDGGTHELGLDLGATVSFLSSDLFDSLAKAHPARPRMTGAVAAANLWGLAEEPGWKVMRLPEVDCGGVRMNGVVAVSLRSEVMGWISERAGTPTAGLIGAHALLDQRVGVSYARKNVYLDPARARRPHELDVVGLVLRPEADGRFTVIGVPEWEGQPVEPRVRPGDILHAVDGFPIAGSTMGAVWSRLGGRPGDVRRLTLERDGREVRVVATVRRFLEGSP